MLVSIQNILDRKGAEVQQIAEVARLSRFHFARAFKRSFGVPPHRCHTSRRMERAKTLLEAPARSVTEVGIADVSNSYDASDDGNPDRAISGLGNESTRPAMRGNLTVRSCEQLLSGNRSRPMRLNHFVILAGLLFIAVAGGAITYRHGWPSKNAAEAEAAPPAAPIIAGTVAQHDVPIYLTGVGAVIAFNTDVVRAQIQPPSDRQARPEP
jgi:hypothetical protein